MEKELCVTWRFTAVKGNHCDRGYVKAVLKSGELPCKKQKFLGERGGSELESCIDSPFVLYM